MKFLRNTFYLLLLLSVVSCKQNGLSRSSTSNISTVSDPTTETDGTTTDSRSFINLNLTNDDLKSYMTRLSSLIVARPLRAAEAQLIDQSGKSALSSIIDDWSQENGFAIAAKVFIEQTLQTGGSTKNGIDFDLPGNIFKYIVKNNRSFSEVITADYCVNENMEQITCDTGAPYSAGVLTTRAFLKGNSSRFNLHRAATLLGSFACLEVPLDNQLQNSTDKNQLITLFRASSEAEFTPEIENEPVTNGDNCYSCHSQFSEFTQLFVKFDDQGNYVSSATGLKDPNKEPGRSTNGLFASHFISPGAAGNEVAYIFKQKVDNLAGAAQQIAASDGFIECAVRNYLNYLFSTENTELILLEVNTEIFDAIMSQTQDPSFLDIVKAVVTNEKLISMFIAGAK